MQIPKRSGGIWIFHGERSELREKYGLEDLVSDDYQGSECRLSKVQQRKLAQHLEETLYQTVFSIREHIQVTYNVTYSLSGLRHLLCHLDFVYKKPKAKVICKIPCQ